MTFRNEAVQTFITEVFEQSKARIRAFEGCRHMELVRHKTSPNLLFTLSIWDDEAALENYRASALLLIPGPKPKPCSRKKPKPGR